MSNVYNILHASDFHISAVPYSGGPQGPNFLSKLKRFKLTGHDQLVLEAFARFVYQYGALDNQFDLLALTGDLATSGFRNDLHEALGFLTQSGLASRPWSNGKKPTIEFFKDKHGRSRNVAMPGNHDRYRRVPPLFRPGGTLFDRLFANHWWVGQAAQPWRILKKADARPLALVAADFSLHANDGGKRFFTIPGWYGQGRVALTVRQDLERRTEEARKVCLNRYQEDPVILWAVHFDPAATDETLKLLDSDFLVDLATQFATRQDDPIRIPAILCGHTHECKIKPLSDHTTAFVCGTTSQAHIHSPQDSSRTAHDCQLLSILVPEETSSDRLRIDVTWFRYNDGAGGAARFVPLGVDVRILCK